MTSSEQEFLNNYHPEDYEKPSVAVDLLVFTIEEAALKLVMIRREEMPFQNKLALPGVFVNIRESLEEAAYRGIEEETGLTDIYLEQLYTWGDPERDPRMRIISVSYMALVPIHKIHLIRGKRTTQVSLYPVEELFAEETEIAFDHKKMIACARERIKNKTEYTDVAFAFLPEEFTLPQLQRIYEILLGKELYKANFRKKIKDLVEETEHYTTGVSHRPSQYYRRKGNGEETGKNEQMESISESGNR